MPFKLNLVVHKSQNVGICGGDYVFGGTLLICYYMTTYS